MAVLFTSDTHFGDHRTLNIHRRPFVSAAEMDAVLVERWNAAVAPGDEVWHLGDFARTSKIAAAVLPRLNGTKRLLVGNNDAAPYGEGWASVDAYVETRVEGVALVLCHYPFRSWNGMGRGAVNLHGHSHGRLKPLLRQHDVGVDPRGFAPVTLADVLAPARRRAVRPD